MTLYGSRGEEQSEYEEWRKRQPLLLPAPEPPSRPRYRPSRQEPSLREQCASFFRKVVILLILAVIAVAIAQVMTHS